MDIVFASDNEGKIRELQQLLSQQQIVVQPQKLYDVSPIAETKLTFVENALDKARHCCAQTGMPALADDSGLEVFALGGAPGIRSARFAGEQASSKHNIEKLLQALQPFPDNKRQARFVCVLVFMLHAQDPTPLICEGTWQGSILTSAQGDNGFGYDPVFWVADQQLTAAQLPASMKNKLSHRAKALTALLQKLPEKLCKL